MVVTAVVKYWYHSKNLALSIGGQIILGAYITTITINRLTTYVSIFAVTQPLDLPYDDKSTIPYVNLEAAGIIFILVILVQWCGVAL